MKTKTKGENKENEIFVMKLETKGFKKDSRPVSIHLNCHGPGSCVSVLELHLKPRVSNAILQICLIITHMIMN